MTQHAEEHATLTRLASAVNDANGPMLGFHDREGFTTPESMKGFAIMGAGRR